MNRFQFSAHEKDTVHVLLECPSSQPGLEIRDKELLKIICL